MKFEILGDNAFFNLSQNYFRKNVAVLGGGGIYFNNKLLSESPNRSNIFIDNRAAFANDFLTFPIRLKVAENGNLIFKKTTKTYLINAIPGITQISLSFDVIDYYGNTIESLSGG